MIGMTLTHLQDWDHRFVGMSAEDLTPGYVAKMTNADLTPS